MRFRRFAKDTSPLRCNATNSIVISFDRCTRSCTTGRVRSLSGANGPRLQFVVVLEHRYKDEAHARDVEC